MYSSYGVFSSPLSPPHILNLKNHLSLNHRETWVHILIYVVNTRTHLRKCLYGYTEIINFRKETINKSFILFYFFEKKIIINKIRTIQNITG